MISSAELVPVMRLARRAGLGARVTAKLTVPGGAGSDAAAKVCSIVAGMLTGADSIDDINVLREDLPGVGGHVGQERPLSMTEIIRSSDHQ